MSASDHRPSEDEVCPRHLSVIEVARIALLIAAGLAALAFFSLGGQKYLTLTSIRDADVWLHQNFSPASILLIYFVGATSWVICALPAATIIMLLAGALFGPWLGTVACVIATSTGAVISMMITRLLFRDFVKRRFARQAAVVEREYARSGSHYLIAMRLIPILPYFITNLLFGVTSIRPVRFWATSMLASTPAIFIYANAGSELAKITSLEDILTWRLAAALGALACLPFIGRYVTKKFFRLDGGPETLGD